MATILKEVQTAHSPESLAANLRGTVGLVLLRSRFFASAQARYSFVAARPFLRFRSFGSRCEIAELAAGTFAGAAIQFGNPWHVLDQLMSRYELLDEADLPFPLGGCFGFWGYDLKNFVEPKLPRRTDNDLELADCHVGFYDSLVVFDHHLGKTWIISTGLGPDGARNESRAMEAMQFWKENLDQSPTSSVMVARLPGPGPLESGGWPGIMCPPSISSNLSRAEMIQRIHRAQEYIRSGHIYQVNLSQRLCAGCDLPGWDVYQRLSDVSPAPFSAFVDCEDFQIASSSPELFLRLSGSAIQTRPIKGTRPRSVDPTRDTQLTYELKTSAKEMSELVMITDLLRNDIGRVCAFGSVHVPELARLEQYPQVQHLVSTVEGRLRQGVTHFMALSACFPGGSITGAPKIRAMEIIDELETVSRGPYTGALGYLGFNRESQLSIVIRSAVCRRNQVFFQVGAGIVADSVPEAEYAETVTKAAGFIAALGLPVQDEFLPRPGGVIADADPGLKPLPS